MAKILFYSTASCAMGRGRRKGLFHFEEEAAWLAIDHVGPVHHCFLLSQLSEHFLHVNQPLLVYFCYNIAAIALRFLISLLLPVNCSYLNA